MARALLTKFTMQQFCTSIRHCMEGLLVLTVFSIWLQCSNITVWHPQCYGATRRQQHSCRGGRAVHLDPGKVTGDPLKVIKVKGADRNVLTLERLIQTFV